MSEAVENKIQLLLDYIDNARKSGHTDSAIKAILSSKGLTPKTIDYLLEHKKIEKHQETTSTAYDREKDVITEDQFDEIEKKENKNYSKNPVLGSQEKSDNSDKVKIKDFDDASKEITKLKKMVEEVSLSISKEDGKIDILSQKNDLVSSKMDNITEKIGELRSTVMNRERNFNRLEEDFNSVKYVVSVFKPDVLEKKFGFIDSKTLGMESNIEKITLQIGELKRSLDAYSEMIGAVKSYEGLIKRLGEMKELDSKMRSNKEYIDKMLAKIEVMFGTIDESIGKISNTDVMSRKNEAAIKEIMIDMDKLNLAEDSFIKKEEFIPIRNDVNIMKKTLFEKEFQGSSTKK